MPSGIAVFERNILNIMDNKLLRQWGSEILSYRLRTARKRKRDKKNDFHKHLLQLDKERRALELQIRNLGWEPLVPPVQKGWKRLFVLREDVARSKQAEFYAGILAKINTVQWDHRKDFLKKKRVFGRKKYVVREQFLLRPSEHHFAKLAFSEKEKQQFSEEWIYNHGRKIYIKQYVFIEPWRFRLKVQPNLIDKVRKTDPELEARLHEIESFLEINGFERVLGRLLDRNSRWWKNREPPKHQEVFYRQNKPLLSMLDVLQEEKI